MIGFSERHIRLCNGEWELCDGDCEYCQKASYTNTTNTTAEYRIDSTGKVVKIDNDER